MERINWKEKRMVRRVLQYVIGLCVMAAGTVLLKRAALGITPITSVPAAVANVTPFTLGNTTIALHVLCVIGQILVVRRFTVKALLTMLVGVPFGYIIDLFMWLFDPGPLGVFPRIVLLVFGLILTGLGVLLVVGSDLMLPAPDELTHTISEVYGKKLSNVKFISDAIYVIVALAIDLIFAGKITSVGIGTVCAVLLTGRLIGLFGKMFPGMKMSPFWKKLD